MPGPAPPRPVANPPFLLQVHSTGDWWEASPDSPFMRMAERAVEKEWGVQPLLVREGAPALPPPLPLPRHCPLTSLASCLRPPPGPCCHAWLLLRGMLPADKCTLRQHWCVS